TVSKSQFGAHIIRLDATPSTRVVRAAVLSRSVEVGTATEREAYAKAQQFAASSLTEEGFNASVEKLKINKNIAMEVKPEDKTISGLSSARNVVMWAFNEETNVGDVSEALDVDNGTRFVIARLAEK